jgi:gag-polypeptide of LTR copia-type
MSDMKMKNVGVLKAGKWQIWSSECKAALRSQGLWSYIEGLNSKKPADPKALPIWSDTNDRIVGALCQIVDYPLWRGIEDFTTAREAWNFLKSKTYQHGIISKMNTLQAAVRIRFTSHNSFDSTINELKDQLAIIYDQKPPSKDEWLIVLLLQTLSDGEFEWIRKNLIGFMTTSTTSLTSADIIARLEAEFQDLDNKKTQETILAARTSRSGPPRTN